MTEKLFQFIWQFQLFDKANLFTLGGDKVEIQQAGQLNRDAGPDFFDSRIRIGKTLWAGNTELHLKVEDWRKHHHQVDENYKNIILHVLFETPKDDIAENSIPTIVLKEKIPQNLLDTYHYMMDTVHWAACQDMLGTVDSITLQNWLDRLAISRLERKCQRIHTALFENQNNWERTFYHQLARNFGFHLNSEPFEMLAKSIPLHVLAKHHDSLFQIEALFFGQAGFLDDDFIDEYPAQLKLEYRFLRAKYDLNHIPKHLWKFLRTRPANFPTIRISQFASLIHKSSHLFSKIIEIEKVDDVFDLLDCETSEYWQSHYSCDKDFKKSSIRNLGKTAIDNIIINTVVPLLFAYAKHTDMHELSEKALAILESCSSESNSIIKKWNELNVNSINALQSQALIELRTEYCEKKHCLNCAIGCSIMRKGRMQLI